MVEVLQIYNNFIYWNSFSMILKKKKKIDKIILIIWSHFPHFHEFSFHPNSKVMFGYWKVLGKEKWFFQFSINM